MIFLLLIPLVTVIFLVIFFQKKMAIWEYVLVFGIPIIAIFIGNITSISSQTKDLEFWNSYATRATYYEPWDEYIHRTCSREVCSGSGDNRTCHTEYYDCSYVENHPAQWVVEDNIKTTYGVSSSYFEGLCKMWGTRNFRDMHRSYHSYDGDAYDTWYNKGFEHTIPVCRVHTYENKVQCSKSVFNFQEVDTSDINKYHLFSYPSAKGSFFKHDNETSEFNYNPILGYEDRNASRLLSIYNGLNGADKQLHMLLLIFNDQPIEAGVLQESYWKGGNKNEFILCIGVSEKKITWTKVISWTEVEELKVRVARQVKEMDTLNVTTVVNYLGQEVPKNFVRKRFRDFNYLTVEPTTTAIIVTAIITLLVAIGLAIYSVKNEFELSGRNWKRTWPRF